MHQVIACVVFILMFLSVPFESVKAQDITQAQQELAQVIKGVNGSLNQDQKTTIRQKSEKKGTDCAKEQRALVLCNQFDTLLSVASG